MTMFAGLDVGFKHTAICVMDVRGEIVWRGILDMRPESALAALTGDGLGLHRGVDCDSARPPSWWRRRSSRRSTSGIRINNPLERILREIQRRPRVSRARSLTVHPRSTSPPPGYATSPARRGRQRGISTSSC
jgi:hypothetical protein